MAKVRRRLQLTKNTFLPDFGSFVSLHKESYDWFLKEGLWKAVKSMSPITDTLEKMWKLEFLDYELREPEHTLEECMEYELTYSYPMYVKVKLTNLQTGKEQVQDAFFANIPAMTPEGYFVINGVVRIVRLQIVRSEGVVFDLGKKKNVPYPYIARLIPQKGGWYTFDINKKGVITVALVRGRYKVHLTTLLRALKGYSNAQIQRLFADVEGADEFIKETLKYDKTRSREEAVLDIYSRIRPADVVTYDRANRFVRGFFFNARRFYLGEVGRYQLNTKLGLRFKRPRLYVKDLVAITKHLINLNKGLVAPEDVDDLSNRRIRTVGEVLVEVVDEAMARFERSVKDRMSRHGADADIAPVAIVHNKVVTAQLESFLAINPLSKFMGQLNIFEHVEDLRRITAKGPRGLTGDNATLSVRDIHYSHYSRLGVVATAEGITGGLISHLAVFAKVNKYGFIEAPYRKLKNKVAVSEKELTNRILAEEVKIGSKTLTKGTFITKELATQIAKSLKGKQDEVKVFPFLTDEVEYLSYLQEKPKYIGLSTYKHDEFGNYLPDIVLMRHSGEYKYVPVEQMEYVDVVPYQLGSLGFTLIPFVDHTYSYRAMVATNMQRQAMPLVNPKAPVLGTGVERLVAKSTGKTILAPETGEVVYADANYVIFKGKSGKKYEYKVDNFTRTNDNTVITQKVRVVPGEKLEEGDLIIDGPSTEQGELALGRDILVAVMPYEGFNYDDSFAISERLLRDNVFTTVELKLYTQNLREASTGPEILTSDIPGVPYELLRNLDVSGVVRVGALVRGGDILAGIIAHKGEKSPTPEEALLQAVFGELSKDVKNNSLRMPYGSEGIVVKTEVLSRENGDVLPAGVLKRVKVWVAELKRVSYGDKFSGLYGDKGTIANILPIEDMPYTEDGTPVDLIISPLLVKRMNMGILPQITFASIAKATGKYLALPSFDELNEELVNKLKAEVKPEILGKQNLYDGRSGKKFENVVTVGYKYVVRLKHIADKKMAARSTGPYSVVTQQPVGGKAHKGGLRFGEMEVWVLEAHNAPYNLQELLTIKSDDVEGRNKAYKAILEGEKIEIRNIPESFNVLLRELNALGIRVDVKKVKEEIK